MTRHRWSGTLTLSAPPERAFVAFTPRGECGWAPGWAPVFHGPADDDSAPGTVFDIEHGDSRSVWHVVDRREHVGARRARRPRSLAVARWLADRDQWTFAPRQPG